MKKEAGQCEVSAAGTAGAGGGIIRTFMMRRLVSPPNGFKSIFSYSK